jgi:Heterokaryon incompatibility protein (HET)
LTGNNPEVAAKLFLMVSSGDQKGVVFAINRTVGALRMLDSANKPWSERTERMISSRWIDQSLPKRWKEHCDRHHRSECRRLPMAVQYLSSRPTWLVDTWRQCLISGSNIEKYVALSYVWGQGNSFKACKANIDELQFPGIFSALTLPKTIKDALKFTEMLGERYIWVDCLCIIQDDEEMKHHDIGNMSAIFGNSSLTLIAAQSHDANSGLIGFPQLSGPRNYNQEVYKFRGGIKLLFDREIETRESLTASIWASRGWTFQESIFSRRQIIFHNDSIQWECGEACCSEEFSVRDPRLNSEIVKVRGMLSSTFPDYEGLMILLSDYNKRDFSYPEDVLFAFAGLARPLRSSFKGGFISGLPARGFYIGMLWQPVSYALRRNAIRDRTGHACLPTWSWVGWKCSLVSFSWSSGNGYVDYCSTVGASTLPFTPELVIPLVQWYSHETVESSGIAIHDDWDHHRRQYFNRTRNPPADWTRHTIAERNPMPYDNMRKPPEARYIYRHVSDPESTFWHPVPLPDTTDQLKWDIFPPYISCRTRRAWLPGSKPHEPAIDGLILLKGHLGECIGGLQPLEIPIFGEAEGDAADSGQYLNTFELVEISRGELPEKFFHQLKRPYGLIGEPKSTFGGRYEYYHVLWIERKDKVAYRKGLGRVDKQAWEAQRPEWIDLMLG